MESIKFSVIVPCYNVAEYLDACVESILAQDYLNFEILLIDDGSTDETAVKCDAWEKADARIRCFHKENGGLSDARNFGIARAVGQYVLFVDSDDYIAPKSLSSFAETIEGYASENNGVLAQVVITRLVEIYPDQMIEHDTKMSDMLCKAPSRTEAVRWIMQGTKNTWPSVKYILSKDLIDTFGMRFKKGYLHEDVDWTARLCCYASCYAVCDYPWYYHRMSRGGSITNTVKPKRVTDVLAMAFSLIDGEESDLLKKLDAGERQMLQTRLMASVYATLSLYSKLDSEGRRQVVDAVNRQKSIFRICVNLRHKMFCFAMKMLGTRLALELLALARR